MHICYRNHTKAERNTTEKVNGTTITTRNAHQAQNMHPGKDAPLQQLSCRICCLRDIICNEGIPFHPHCRDVECTVLFCP